jgi:methyl-accepting chemotaxis protein/hemerythrin
MAVSVYKVKWDKNMSVGNAELDEQHKLFFEFTNNLLLNYDNKNDKNEVLKTINSLVDFSVYHFDFEEDFLREMNYPHLDRHIDLHNSFRARVDKFKEELSKGNEEVMDKIIIYLIRWIKEHTYVEDLDYKNYIES